MFSTSKYFVVLLVTSVSGYLNVFNYEKRVDELFNSHGVVPNVIPKAPKGIAYVIHPSGLEAALGNEVTPRQARDPPTIGWNVEPDYFYTHIMIDLDERTSTDPSNSAFLHWLVGNIQETSKGEPIAEYMGPAPAPMTDLHRYVFLVYGHTKKLVFDETRVNNTSIAGRPGFSIANFVDKYKLGRPTAGNLYRARYDELVPLLRAQAGDDSLLYCLLDQNLCKTGDTGMEL